ncbi:MAG: class I SAM-dependent methyltransferase [Gammaproteobacteria bacterium]
METVESRTVQAQQSAASFPLLVEQIVGEILGARDLPEISYLMGRLLGAKHLVDFTSMTSEQVARVRELIQPLAENSFTLSWALRKPYGYAGDFFALETLYDNQVSPSSTPLGQMLDRWFLDTQLATGVRARKDMLRAFIEKKVRAHAAVTDEPFRLLSVASGSARELRDLPEDLLQKIEITLVDQDPRSLEFAMSHLPDSVTGMQRNALRLKPDSFPHTFDLVYSFGFFDYLSDDLIIHNLKLCRSVLSAGGSVVFPLKMNSKYRHWFYDVFMDWRFVERELEDGLRLATKAGLSVVELLETENESVIFYHCVPQDN